MEQNGKVTIQQATEIFTGLWKMANANSHVDDMERTAEVLIITMQKSCKEEA